MTLDPKSPRDETLARLLAGRDAPSVLEKERQFEAIFAKIQAPKRPRWQPFAASVGGALCLAAALALWLRTPELASRGPALAEQPELRALCAKPCRQGGALAFEVSGSPKRGFFAAFAQRADGAIVWYLPDASGQSAPLARGNGPAVLDHGVQLGPEQPPGVYEIYGIFSEQPMTRAQIKAALGDDLRGRDGVTVVQRRFEVEP